MQISSGNCLRQRRKREICPQMPQIKLDIIKNLYLRKVIKGLEFFFVMAVVFAEAPLSLRKPLCIHLPTCSHPTGHKDMVHLNK
jgi:hypothetical protein